MGGVFGISKHVYSGNRFCTPEVATSAAIGSYTNLQGIIMTGSEVQQLIDQFLSNPSENQVYIFDYITIYYDGDFEGNIISTNKIFIDIPLLYNATIYSYNEPVGSTIYNYQQESPNYRTPYIIGSDHVEKLQTYDFHNGYSAQDFLNGIRMS